jgi:hypothetical protein
MVREQSFSRSGNENPYHHLREFEQLCLCLMISGMTQETLKWKLFPFSLTETVKQWYMHVMKTMNGDWNDLRDRFCLAFFPIYRVITLQVEVLSFHKGKKKFNSAAWARFLLLTQSCPNLCIPNHVLLQHFHLGLSKNSTVYLNIIVGGSFMHKTSAEERDIRDQILENTSFVYEIEPLQVEAKIHHEEALVAESESAELPS